MNDDQGKQPRNGGETELDRDPARSVPEPGPVPEPAFDEPSPPAPEVIDAPGRNTEF